MCNVHVHVSVMLLSLHPINTSLYYYYTCPQPRQTDDRPLSYFPGEHLRVVSLAASNSTDDVDRRHLGLAAADVSRVY